MNVVAFNGSPRPNGNTSLLLTVVAEELTNAGIEMERIDIAAARPRGCIACRQCSKNRDERCAIQDDPVNEWIQRIKQADGVIFGSPTYFANVTAEMKALIDRVGMVARANGALFRRKVAAAVIAVRRGGAVPAFDAINHMFQINEMIVVGSSYWNFGVGFDCGEVLQDAEGIKTVRNLGQNMAWLIKKLGS
jgi:multimeric flavodoxin WrbA